MENHHCPSCKNNTPTSYELCSFCKFPFNGTENEKSLHIGKFISAKNILDKSEENIQNSKKILFMIVAFNILGVVISVMKNQYDFFGILISTIITLTMLFCALYLHKKPMILTIIPLSLILLIYTINFIFSRETFFQGIIFKTIILFALTYNLYTLNQANKFKKENNLN